MPTTPISEEEKDAIIQAVFDGFGFCGCGRPECAVEFIRAGLQHIHDLQFKVWTNVITYGQWVEEGEKLFAGDGVAYFFYYWADKEGLTEHGGSVPGWLDTKGLDLLEKLNAVLA